MINNKKCFIDCCNNTLQRAANAVNAHQRLAVLDHEVMIERELAHTTRLTMFRGGVCPTYKNEEV